jgi:hypothetical protein
LDWNDSKLVGSPLSVATMLTKLGREMQLST